MPRKREPKKRTVETEIVVEGKKKRIIATHCTIKSPLLSRLGFGKKREVMACQSVDIIELDEQHAASMDDPMALPSPGNDNDDMDEEAEMEEQVPMPRQQRAKARPTLPMQSFEEDEDFNERPSPSRRVFQERKEFLDDPRFRERQPAEPRRPSLYDRRKPVDRRRLPEP